MNDCSKKIKTINEREKIKNEARQEKRCFKMATSSFACVGRVSFEDESPWLDEAIKKPKNIWELWQWVMAAFRQLHVNEIFSFYVGP